MGWLTRVIKSSLGVKGTAPGKSVLAHSQAGDQDRITEVYLVPGLSSLPAPGDRLVEIPVGTGVRVAIASHNYRIEIDPDEGETVIYSTDSGGESIKATLRLKPDGSMELNGDTKRLVTWDELNVALQTFVAALSSLLASTIGSPAPTLDISSSKTTTVKTGG